MTLINPKHRTIPLVYDKEKFSFQYLYGEKESIVTQYSVFRVIQSFFISDKPLIMKEQRLMVHTEKGKKQTFISSAYAKAIPWNSE